MSLFSDSLKKWFYHNDSNSAKAGTRICLLDASGNPAGSDELLRSLSFAQCPDDYVDMGLPSGTLWAKKNLGAVSETDYGMYVSWGNLELHAKGEGYDFSSNTYNNTPAAAISANLTLEQDIAHNVLGCGWKMPTREQFVELVNNCTSTWTSDYNSSGIAGRVFTATNGNTLFFPAAGSYNGTTFEYENERAGYYETDINTSTRAYHFSFGSSDVKPQITINRWLGLPIRHVL